MSDEKELEFLSLMDAESSGSIIQDRQGGITCTLLRYDNGRALIVEIFLDRVLNVWGSLAERGHLILGPPAGVLPHDDSVR